MSAGSSTQGTQHGGVGWVAKGRAWVFCCDGFAWRVPPLHWSWVPRGLGVGQWWALWFFFAYVCYTPLFLAGNDAFLLLPTSIRLRLFVLLFSLKQLLLSCHTARRHGKQGATQRAHIYPRIILPSLHRLTATYLPLTSRTTNSETDLRPYTTHYESKPTDGLTEPSRARKPASSLGWSHLATPS